MRLTWVPGQLRLQFLGHCVVELHEHRHQARFRLVPDLMEEPGHGVVQEPEVRLGELRLQYRLMQPVEQVREGDPIPTEPPPMSEEPPPRAASCMGLAHPQFDEPVVDEPPVHGLFWRHPSKALRRLTSKVTGRRREILNFRFA